MVKPYERNINDIVLLTTEEKQAQKIVNAKAKRVEKTLSSTIRTHIAYAKGELKRIKSLTLCLGQTHAHDEQDTADPETRAAVRRHFCVSWW